MLKKERAEALGDPVRRVTTPYVQSFDTTEGLEPQDSGTSATASSASSGRAASKSRTSRENDEHLNFLLNRSELRDGIKHSQWLSTTTELALTQSDMEEENHRTQDEGQKTATEAMRRIASLSLGSSKDRLRVNIQRCITDFGRHNTDDALSPRLESTVPKPNSEELALTGESTSLQELQSAEDSTSAKIRTLADFLEGRGRMDKVNKRNLRLLVHRRAKLLKYLRRKERGGPRFQNIVSTLGLTDGTWKGQITL